MARTYDIHYLLFVHLQPPHFLSQPCSRTDHALMVTSTWWFVSKGYEASQYDFPSSMLVLLSTVRLWQLCWWYVTTGSSHRSSQLCTLSVRLNHLLWQSRLASAVMRLALLHLLRCMQNFQFLGCPHLELSQQAGGWGHLLYYPCIGTDASAVATFLSEYMEVWTFHWVLWLAVCGQCVSRI